MRANFKDNWVNITTGKGQTQVHVKRGQFIFGRNRAAKALKQNPTSVYKRMLKLEKCGNLNIKSDTHYSIVTIINWETYQGSDLESDNQSDNQVTTKCQPSNTDKKDKKVKNDNNSLYPFDNFWNDFGKKVDTAKCKAKYTKLSENERALIKVNVPLYVKEHQDVQFRKNPLTYLNGQCWNDELTKNKPTLTRPLIISDKIYR